MTLRAGPPDRRRRHHHRGRGLQRALRTIVASATAFAAAVTTTMAESVVQVKGPHRVPLETSPHPPVDAMSLPSRRVAGGRCRDTVSMFPHGSACTPRGSEIGQVFLGMPLAEMVRAWT